MYLSNPRTAPATNASTVKLSHYMYNAKASTVQFDLLGVVDDFLYGDKSTIESGTEDIKQAGLKEGWHGLAWLAPGLPDRRH